MAALCYKTQVVLAEARPAAHEAENIHCSPGRESALTPIQNLPPTEQAETI